MRDKAVSRWIATTSNNNNRIKNNRAVFSCVYVCMCVSMYAIRSFSDARPLTGIHPCCIHDCLDYDPTEACTLEWCRVSDYGIVFLENGVDLV